MAAVCVVFLAGCNGSLDGGDTKSFGQGEFTPTSGSISKASANVAQTPSTGASIYKVGPQDSLEINVFSVPALSRQMQVSSDGTINMPLVGEIRAAGKTTQQLERELTARLGAKYLQNPQVSINIKEYNSQRFTVEGAVKKPGVFPIKINNTLLQCISAAEGLDADTAQSTIVVFRTEKGQRLGAKFDLEAIRSGQMEDPLIIDGDVIVVPTSFGKNALSSILKTVPLLTVFKPV